jgi:hypothetical protein
MNRDRVRRYVERHDDATVPQVLGRFELAPSAADEVRELLDPNNRARVRQSVPQDPGESNTSAAEGICPESRDRKTKSGYPGLPGLPGQNSTPSLEFGGRGGVRARVGRKNADCCGGDE